MVKPAAARVNATIGPYTFFDPLHDFRSLASKS